MKNSEIISVILFLVLIYIIAIKSVCEEQHNFSNAVIQLNHSGQLETDGFDLYYIDFDDTLDEKEIKYLHDLSVIYNIEGPSCISFQR